MPRNGWFHSYDQNFDIENVAQRKIDDYPHTGHLDDHKSQQENNG